MDAATGQVLREVAAHAGNRLGRIVGAPAFGSLWECTPGSLMRVDADAGVEIATIPLPPDEGCLFAVGVPGVDGSLDRLIPMYANVLVDPATNTIASSFDVGGRWYDAIQLDGRLWLDVGLRDASGSALVELDPESGIALQTINYPGAGYSNTTYVSGNLAATPGFIWVLADPTADQPDGPQIIRIPHSELK